MTALIGRVGSEVDGMDMFGGYGGAAQGLHAGGVTVTTAANHNEMAVANYAANFPKVDVRRADLVDSDCVDYVDPANFPPARILWASPSCKFHSPANALKLYQGGPQAVLPGFEDEDFDEVRYANSERSRVTMSCPLRYAAKHRPELVLVENVVEAAYWGPGRDGSTFRWWLNEWTKLGYDYECCFLNSMFFPPCPQSRDRLYVVIWRKGNRKPDLDYRPDAYCVSDRCGGKMVQARQTWKPRTAAWPLPRWGKYRDQYTYTCPECRNEVAPVAWPAYTAIDWTDLGPMMSERRLGAGPKRRPLAATTMERVRRSVAKVRYAPGLVIPCKAAWGTDKPVTEPFSTQTTQMDKALVTNGFILPVSGNTYESGTYTRSRHVSDQAPTQHTSMCFGFAHQPSVVEMRGGGSVTSGQHPVTGPLHTVTAGGLHHGLVSPGLFQKINGGPGDTAWHHLGEPANTITSRDTTGLVILPWVEQWQADPIAVTAQFATVMTHLRHSLASIDADLEPVTDDELGQVRFRMFRPDPELRRVSAFEDDFILLGNQEQVTAGLGNAVTPPTATWLTERSVATLDERAA